MSRDAAHPLPDPWNRLPGLGLMAGGAGLALCLIGALAAPRALFPSYLVAFLFWVNISLGCLGALQLHYLVGGAWGFLIRRPLEAAVLTLPVLGLLFLVLLLGLHTLYPWSRPELVRADRMLQHKSSYLNVPFFLSRAAVYFGLWSGLALWLRRGAAAQDRNDDPRITWRLQSLSGPGLALTFLAITFAMIDWGMSIEPHWYSTIYGAMLLVGGGLSGLAAMILAAAALARVEPLTVMARPDPFHELGNLLLAFTMLWAYMSFSQYLIVWSGNLTEEIPWYLRRSEHGWRWLAGLLMVFHFFVPFFLLLFRMNKRVSQNLWKVAALLLVMQWLNDVWLIMPAFPQAGWGTLLFLPAATVGIGGVWIAVFARRLAQRSLLPRHDPLLAEVLVHEGAH
jgi:hypothetical protein